VTEPAGPLLFRKAAEQGVAPAQFNLGGQGVPQDDVLAHMGSIWRRPALKMPGFNLAAARFEDATSRQKAVDSHDELAAKMRASSTRISARSKRRSH
jgi:hypothetical protein